MDQALQMKRFTKVIEHYKTFNVFKFEHVNGVVFLNFK